MNKVDLLFDKKSTNGRINNIVADYAAADEDLRLSMFLTHRDLRQYFTAIDMAEKAQRETVMLKQTRGTKSTRLAHRFACNCWGWLKHCWSTKS